MAESINNNDESNGFWNTLRELLLQRFTSPLISTFVISWCVTNYKVLLIVFGKGEIPDKLKLLDDYFMGTLISIPAATWIYGIPAVMTIFYIFVYPHINLWVMEYVNENDNKLKTQQELNKYKKVVDQLRHDAINLTTKLNEATDEVTRLEAAAREELDRQEENTKNHQRNYERLESEKTGLEAELLTAKSSLETTNAELNEVTEAFNTISTAIFAEGDLNPVEEEILEKLWPMDDMYTGVDSELLKMSVMKGAKISHEQYSIALARLRNQELLTIEDDSGYNVIKISPKARNLPDMINRMRRPRRL